jgi:hypothetical protein
MSSQEERKENTGKVGDVIKVACKGNPHAEAYLMAVAVISRTMDDLFDKDCPVSDADVCKTFFLLLGGLQLNPFYRENTSGLVGVHIAAFNAWMDANGWEKDSDESKRLYAHVTRDFINELFGVVAFICGGYEHMREVSILARETFLKEVESNGTV